MVGVPEMTPSGERVNPAGSCPEAIDQIAVMSYPPVVVRVTVGYATPGVPSGNVGVVMTSGEWIKRVRSAEAVIVPGCGGLWDTVTVKLAIPAVVGVPEI